MKLQPIESAPNDGTHVLLFGEIDSDTGTVLDGETESTPIKAFFEGYYLHPLGWYHVGMYPANPTHWMPLPEGGVTCTPY